MVTRKTIWVWGGEPKGEVLLEIGPLKRVLLDGSYITDLTAKGSIMESARQEVIEGIKFEQDGKVITVEFTREQVNPNKGPEIVEGLSSLRQRR